MIQRILLTHERNTKNICIIRKQSPTIMQKVYICTDTFLTYFKTDHNLLYFNKYIIMVATMKDSNIFVIK
jgi:hypothetical protein